jgi:Autophagy receptor ATG43
MEEIARTFAQTASHDLSVHRNSSPTREVSSAGRPSPIHIVRHALPSIQFSSSRANLAQLSHPGPDDDLPSEEEDEDSRHHHRRGRRRPQRPPLPVIPDLRFEQAYLKQLEAAKGSLFWIIVITIREQVLFPGIQGFLWALGIAGLRTLRTTQAESGAQWGTWLREMFAQFKITSTGQS